MKATNLNINNVQHIRLYMCLLHELYENAANAYCETASKTETFFVLIKLDLDIFTTSFRICFCCCLNYRICYPKTLKFLAISLPSYGGKTSSSRSGFPISIAFVLLRASKPAFP